MISEKLVPISLAFSKSARFLAIFALMASVSDQEFALWATCGLLLQYTLFLQLGIPGPAAREVAIAIGREDWSRSDALKVLALRVQNVAAAVIAITGALVFAEKQHVTLIVGYLICSHFSALVVTLARFSLQMRAVILSQLCEGVIIAAAVLYLLPSISVPQLMTTYVAASIAASCICLPATQVLKRSLSFELWWSAEFKALLLQAIPLLFFNFLILFRGTWDVIVVGISGDQSETGFLATQPLTDSFRTLSAILLSAFIPAISFYFGKANEVVTSQLLNYLKRSIKISTYIGLILILITFFLGESVLRNFFPQYQDFGHSFFYKIVTLVVGLISMPYYSFLSAVRRVRAAILIVSSSLSIGLLSAFLISFHADLITSVLTGSMLANCISLLMQRLHFRYRFN